jgi:hypothetical protein
MKKLPDKLKHLSHHPKVAAAGGRLKALEERLEQAEAAALDSRRKLGSAEFLATASPDAIEGLIGKGEAARILAASLQASIRAMTLDAEGVVRQAHEEAVSEARAAAMPEYRKRIEAATAALARAAELIDSAHALYIEQHNFAYPLADPLPQWWLSGLAYTIRAHLEADRKHWRSKWEALA